MRRTAAEELAGAEVSRAANDESAGMVNRHDSLARPQSGWDPYEVWRTRLKRPSVQTEQREPLLTGEAGAAEPAAERDP